MTRVEEIVIDSIPMHVHIWGKKSLPVIVCLHGLGGTGLSFIQIAEQIENEFCVISINIPGSAGSIPFPTRQEYNVTKLVDWLKIVLSKLFVRRFSFLGHSWGAQLAIFYINRYPDEVEKCILIDGGYYRRGYLEDETLSIDEEIESAIKSDNEYHFESISDYLAEEKRGIKNWSSSYEASAVDRAIEEEGTVRWHLSNTVTEWALRGMYQDEPYTIYKNILRQNLGYKLLLLQATFPENRKDRDILSRIFSEGTGGRVEKMYGCSHAMHSENSAEVCSSLQKFIKG